MVSDNPAFQPQLSNGLVRVAHAVNHVMSGVPSRIAGAEGQSECFKEGPYNAST